MLSKVVTSYLKERIPEKIEELAPTEKHTPFMRIRAEWAYFGDIELYDDGDEITIFFGRFTHSHFSNYDDISLEEKEAKIAVDVYGVLKATFDDELEFWGANERSGGFRGVDYKEEEDDDFLSGLFRKKGKKTFYRWSGATRTEKS